MTLKKPKTHRVRGFLKENPDIVILKKDLVSKEERRPWSAKDEESYWRRPFSRAELAAGVISMFVRERKCV